MCIIFSTRNLTEQAGLYTCLACQHHKLSNFHGNFIGGKTSRQPQHEQQVYSLTRSTKTMSTANNTGEHTNKTAISLRPHGLVLPFHRSMHSPPTLYASNAPSLPLARVRTSEKHDLASRRLSFVFLQPVPTTYRTTQGKSAGVLLVPHRSATALRFTCLGKGAEWGRNTRNCWGGERSI